MRFPTACTECGHPGDVRMVMTDIPHFKEVIIMAFRCTACGFKDIEVKGGGGVPPQGTVHELRAVPGESMEIDMRRDVIKSDTASVTIPEVGLELTHGTLGGVYTTVEGLLDKIRSKLEEVNPFATSSVDSSAAEDRARYDAFLGQLDDVVNGRVPFTLRITDPLANSWVYSPYEDDTAPIGEDRITSTRHDASTDPTIPHDDAAVATTGSAADPAEATTASAASAASAAAAAAATAALAAATHPIVGRRRRADPRLTVSHYDRTTEENEDLGLLDMNTDAWDQKVAEATAAGGGAPATAGTEHGAAEHGATEGR